MSKKGVLYAQIQIGDSILHLFNTHLQANYNHSDFHTYMKSIQYRQYQLKELTEFVEEQTKDMTSNDKIVIVGDFNISSCPTSE
jgi:exonuclease III